jgi:glycosyltransferase involved in cell wall biosynthesis
MVLEVPGFGNPRLGAFLYLVVAVPLGVIWGAGATAFLAIQLLSQTTVAGICAMVLRRPFIAMAISSGEVGELAYIQHTRLRRARLFFLRRACALIAQNDQAVEELSEVAAPDRVRKLRNPLATIDPLPLVNASGVMYLGRFSTEKDLPTLLRAWPHVLEEVPQARLTLVGSGGAFRSEEGLLVGMARRDPALAASVTFPGWVVEVRPFLAANDVFVFPSRSEGMSNALLEACAAGRVVVASDIPPNLEVLGSEYPLLFPQGDVDALGAAIVRAIRDEPSRAAACGVIKQRIQRFSKEEVVADLAREIERCLG